LTATQNADPLHDAGLFNQQARSDEPRFAAQGLYQFAGWCPIQVRYYVAGFALRLQMLSDDVGALSGKPRVKRRKRTRRIAVDVEQTRGRVQRSRIDMWKIDRSDCVAGR
jgi:hypothetical protein